MPPGLSGVGRLQGQEHDADKPDGSDDAHHTYDTYDSHDADYTGADRNSH